MISHVNFLTRSISDLHHKKDSAHLLYVRGVYMYYVERKPSFQLMFLFWFFSEGGSAFPNNFGISIRL